MRKIVKILPWQFPKMTNTGKNSITIILQVIASQFNGFNETLPKLHSFFISSLSRRATITNWVNIIFCSQIDMTTDHGSKNTPINL